MANKDKGGTKQGKTAASRSLKEKRAAKKAKSKGKGGDGGGSSFQITGG